MSLTHKQVIENVEGRLFSALLVQDVRSLRRLLHQDIVYSHESGLTFTGIKAFPTMETEDSRLDDFAIRQRTISLFNNIAIVNSVEWRSGQFQGKDFNQDFRVSRSWKFNGRQWQLIAIHVAATGCQKKIPEFTGIQ